MQLGLTGPGKSSFWPQDRIREDKRAIENQGQKLDYTLVVRLKEL